MNTQQKLNPNKLQVGDYLSRTSYMKVVDKGLSFNSQQVQVENEDGMKWAIEAGIVERECYSHNQYLEEKQVTRTELIEIFSKVGDAIYTVNYCKQPKVEDAFDAIANKGKIISNKEMKASLKEKMKGEDRTLIGYTLKMEPAWGRSLVVDLEQTR